MASEALSKMLGGHPLVIAVKGVLLFWLGFVVLMGLTALVWVKTSGAIAFGAGVFGLLLLLGFFISIGHSLAALIHGLGNWVSYRKAKGQIEAGNLSPTYAIQGSVGICVVDEGNRRIFANGSVFAFGEVRSNVAHCNAGDTSMTKHYVSILLKAGPAFKVYFHNEVMARNMAYRLDCSIRGA